VTAPKLTEAQRRMLAFGTVQVSKRMITGSLPDLMTARALVRRGFMFEVSQMGASQWWKFSLTDAGRAALKDGAK